MEGVNLHDFVGELMAIGGVITLFLSIRRQFTEEREKRAREQQTQDDAIRENRHQIELMSKDVGRIDKMEQKLDKIDHKLTDIKVIMERDHASVFQRLTTLEDRGCHPNERSHK